MIKILSWNVNGLRAVLKKGLLDWLKKENPDILCVQEIKAFQNQLPPEILYPADYHGFWNSAERPGYSGVATFTKIKPVRTKCGFGVARFDQEGRVLQTEFDKFTLINIYFPNGKMNEDRLKYKMDFYDETLKHLLKLRKKKIKLVVCGDVNTAHMPIDLSRPAENESVSGFLPMERSWIDKLLKHGFLDSFRLFNPHPGNYSWWDLRTGARQRNIGWRIDYHFISEDLRPSLREAFILPDVIGSDHCPVGIGLDL